MALTDSSAPPVPDELPRRRHPMPSNELGTTLDRLRAGVVAAEAWAFSTSLSTEDIENLYSDACVDALRGTFTETADVAAYVRRHVHNRAISMKQSPSVARRVAVVAEDRAGATPGPHEHAVNGELMAVLYEFIAEQSPSDRNVAWLLANGEKPAQIARALQIPRAQATADCKRLRSSLERFAALQTRPAAICARRREDVEAWQRTGRMPLALRWHLRWHHGCALAVRDARVTVQHALLPLTPVAAAAPHVGVIQQVWHALLTNRATTATQAALSRARRLAPAGGGSAAAGVGVVKAVAVVGAGVAAVHAIVGPPTHIHHRSHHAVVARVAAVTATTPAPGPAPVNTPTTTTPVTTVSTGTSGTPTTTSTTSAPPVAPNAGASTPPSTLSGSGSSPTSSSSSTAAHTAAVSPSGGGIAPSGGGGRTSSSLGAGGTPP